MKVIIGLGANLGDRSRTLHLACEAISREVGPLVGKSQIYETEALQLPGASGAAPAYLNAVVVAESALPPEEILSRLLSIEHTLGRVRGERWASRTIDLDLLGVGSLTAHSATLVLPHPELHKRDFVLLPLIEVAPEWRHPVLGKTPSALWDSIIAERAPLYVRGVFRGE